MGRWRITIDGVGCHHNGKRAIDADLATKDFVKELQLQGHQIEAARFEALGTYLDAEGEEAGKTYYEPKQVDINSPMNIDFLAPAPAPSAG